MGQALFAVATTALPLAALQKTAKQPLGATTSATRPTVGYVAATRQGGLRAAAAQLRGQNEKTREAFSRTYVGVGLVDNPGVPIRALLGSGAALSVSPKRALRHVWYKAKHTPKNTTGRG